MGHDEKAAGAGVIAVIVVVLLLVLGCGGVLTLALGLARISYDEPSLEPTVITAPANNETVEPPRD